MHSPFISFLRSIYQAETTVLSNKHYVS